MRRVLTYEPADHRVVSALAGLLAPHLRGERGQAQNHLVHRIVERAFPIVEVEEHAHPGVGDLFHGVPHLDRPAAEPVAVAHDEDLERWARDERVEQPRQARTSVEALKQAGGRPVMLTPQGPKH
jgi:hypothetical protein